ncbi:rRNA processing/ribosome biogenesis-domain-containing protein [Dendryphion nanum]|uniref:Pre-rRNA-processing protein RIX1 n=1 Tax=Dendryphion nanum TaxID=256645 RepID=A0A9P9DL48_9PLEO|nr:rRNA processing/ribosome biogenesis-domain-containing protein [Dendryphion nanum]
MSKSSESAVELSILRAVTYRLSSTPTTQLPQQIPAIAASLANCKSLLSSTQASGSKTSSEASVAIHKFRTFISTLLQDRTIQGRWTAIVLVKTTVEVGGWEILQKSLPWVRGLLGILTKPDPPTSKKLSLITLARIFILTRDYRTLVREITTPSLPTFIQSSLQIALSNPSNDLLLVILSNFQALLPSHPAMFRTYEKQIQQLLGLIVAPTPSTKLASEQVVGPRVNPSSEVTEAARKLYVQLPCCAPKGATSEEWERALKNTVSNAHRVADKVFRAVVEEWKPAHETSTASNGQTMEDEVQDVEKDLLGLAPWTGIYAGSERFVGLLQLIKEYLMNPTPNSVTLPLSLIVDLVTRVLSLTIPPLSGSKALTMSVRFNNQISKDERDCLWATLPHIHVTVVEVLLAVSRRCEQSVSLDAIILDQLIWLFGAEKNHIDVRTACYIAISSILQRSGPALPKTSIEPLSTLIRACCNDLLPSEQSTGVLTQAPSQAKVNGNGNSSSQGSTNADAFLNASLSTKQSVTNSLGLIEAARNLLPVLFSSIPAQYLSHSTRTLVDRTAILCQHADAMTASVLNPPPSKRFGKPAASILPLVARSFPQKKEVEALVRPRMPVIRTGASALEAEHEVDDEEIDIDGEEEEEEEDEVEDEHEGVVEDHFVGEELDTLLETASHGNNARVDQVASTAGFATSSIPNTVVPVNEEAMEVDSVLPEHLAFKNKRLQAEYVTPSPTKRVKFEGDEKKQTLGLPLPDTDTVMGAQEGTPAAPSGSVPQIETVRQNVVTMPKQDVSDDEGDDDFGELVLGQDSDSEPDA